MAASVERIGGGDAPLGEHKVGFFKVTLTSVTEYDFAPADHGFSNIIYASFNNETSEGDGLLERNYTVANAESIGNIALTGFTSNDVVSVMIVGN